MNDGVVQPEGDQPSPVSEIDFLANVRATERSLLSRGFVFMGNDSVKPGDERSLDQLLAGRREVFGEENVTAVRGVERWLLGGTDDPGTFNLAANSLAVYARAALARASQDKQA